ncbi:MAG: ATP-binding cassette domain-containing protein [Eubacterium sp.]|nr:ATP-binding cassette domain-containing protein [Eubacterium sp.]
MVLEVKELNKSYGTHQVLKGVNFKVESGQALGLLGRNGAGKSTTIRILMDVIRANSGEVLLDGKPINYEKISTGYLPEERGLYPKKKIIDQLVYLAMLKGMSKADAVKACDYWLKRLGMAEHRDVRLDSLSKGNQQKIQLVTTVAHNPDIVILDEPFSGLDPVNALVLEDTVRHEIEAGKIVLFSSHQMNYVEEFCNHIVILNGGQIVLDGDIHEIKRGYKRDKLVIRTQKPDAIKSAFPGKVSEMEDGGLLLQMDKPEDKQQVMQQITSGYEIDEIKVYEPTLNDIFVEYTTDKSKDTEESEEEVEAS